MAGPTSYWTDSAIQGIPGTTYPYEYPCKISAQSVQSSSCALVWRITKNNNKDEQTDMYEHSPLRAGGSKTLKLKLLSTHTRVNHNVGYCMLVHVCVIVRWFQSHRLFEIESLLFGSDGSESWRQLSYTKSYFWGIRILQVSTRLENGRPHTGIQIFRVPVWWQMSCTKRQRSRIRITRNFSSNGDNSWTTMSHWPHVRLSNLICKVTEQQ